MKFKIGDKVLADNSVGIIVEKNKGTWDWEIAFIKNPPKNCWLDCYKESELKEYNWKDIPKTFIQKLKFLFREEGDKDGN